MNPAEQAETIRKFALNGPFGSGGLVIMAAALIALGFIYGWREWRRAVFPHRVILLTAVRLGAMLTALWLLAGPSLMTIIRETTPKTVLFLVDASASMDLVDPPDTSTGDHWPAESPQSSRKEKIVTWLEASEKSWIPSLEGKPRLVRYTFGSEVVPTPGGGWREAFDSQSEEFARLTDLNLALQRVSQDAAKHSIAAAVLVTDGGHNAQGDPRQPAAALRGVPLHILPIGASTMPRDVVLHHTQHPVSVFKDDTVLVDTMVTAHDCVGERLTVELVADDAVVERKSLTINSKSFHSRVALQWTAATLGRHSLRVRVEPLQNEHTDTNNESQDEIEVVDDTIRVLLADSFPRWEFRYLANLFKRDEHVDFDQLLTEADDASVVTGGRPAFPNTLEAWRKYRVAIVGDVTPDQFPPVKQELLRKWIADEGGNLIVIAGDSGMPAAFADQPLGTMIPATASAARGDRTTGLHLAVTAEGKVSPPILLADDVTESERIWREISEKLPVYNLSEISRPKPTSHILIAAVNPAGGRQAHELKAFLSWHYFGAGRVIYIAAPVTYQLRYRMGDEYHHRFWGQLLRWAIARDMSGGSKTVRLSTDKNSYEIGDTAQVLVRLSDLDERPVTGADVRIDAGIGDSPVQVIALNEDATVPGSYRGNFENLPIGTITLRAAGSAIDKLLAAEGHPKPVERTVRVEPQWNVELAELTCNLPLLAQLAAASGGSVTSPAAVGQTLAAMDLTPSIHETQSVEPLWARWSFLWIIVGCLTVEWLARKYWGMI